MILTEEEAKTKWCPFVRLGTLNSAAAPNRLYFEDQQNTPWLTEHVCCIASRCMVWKPIGDGSTGCCGRAHTAR